MDTEKNKMKNNIKGAPYVCVLKCVHNREIEKTGIDLASPADILRRASRGEGTRDACLRMSPGKARIDQVLVSVTQNELLITDMPYISSQNSYLFIRVNVAPFSTFNAFNITNLKKKGQRHKIMKMKI